jgi:hypothetical protein
MKNALGVGSTGSQILVVRWGEGESQCRVERKDNKEKGDSPGAIRPKTPGIVSMLCNQKNKKTVVKAEEEEKEEIRSKITGGFITVR